MKKLVYEARFYAECKDKPFASTRHKCLRCQECVFSQYQWCLEHKEMRDKIDKILFLKQEQGVNDE
jgi:hypothetical protein